MPKSTMSVRPLALTLSANASMRARCAVMNPIASSHPRRFAIVCCTAWSVVQTSRRRAQSASAKRSCIEL